MGNVVCDDPFGVFCFVLFFAASYKRAARCTLSVFIAGKACEAMLGYPSDEIRKGSFFSGFQSFGFIDSLLDAPE